jgi:hypothetical protein
MNDNKVDTYIFGNMTRLKELRVAHRDLDDVITRLAENPLVDQLQLKRLKKRKLAAEGPDHPARERADPGSERLTPAETRDAADTAPWSSVP